MFYRLVQMILSVIIIGIVLLCLGVGGFVYEKLASINCPPSLASTGSIFSYNPGQLCNYILQYSQVGAGILVAFGMALVIGGYAENKKSKPS